jgi:type I restriction enzyme S subunit
MSDSEIQGWSRQTVSECCDILDSKRIPLNSDERRTRKGIYPYYGANGIQDFIDDFIFDGDAILLAEDGGNFEHYSSRPIAQWVTGKFWVNNHAHILRAKKRVLDKWIYYSLVHKNILKFINGGTRSKLNQSDLKEIDLLIPPLPEQQKIASILTSVDDVIEKTQSQINKLLYLKKGTMNELLTKGIGHTEFVDGPLGKIPKGWEVKQLGETTEVINGRAYKLTEWEETGTPVIRLQNLTQRGGDFYYSTMNLPDKQYCHKGDLLFMWSASFGPYIWWGDKAIYHYHIWKMVPKKGKIDKQFLYFYLQQKTDEWKKNTSGMAMLHLTKQGIEETNVTIPPLSEQERIASILSSIDNNIEDKKRKLEQTKSLKKSLMQDLLTGKVRVNQ